jgi:hypothetical protein
MALRAVGGPTLSGTRLAAPTLPYTAQAMVS